MGGWAKLNRDDSCQLNSEFGGFGLVLRDNEDKSFLVGGLAFNCCSLLICKAFALK